MVCTGVSVSFIIGTLLAWRTLALVGKIILKHPSHMLDAYNLIRKLTCESAAGIVPCAVLLVGLSIIPESPRWLVRT